MSKKITVSFYDACLPDYFGGHHRPVLQYPVDGSTTRKELYAGLLSELAEGVIDYQINENRLDYDTIRQAIKECIFFKPECKEDDILFPDLELWTDDNDNCESCYAFFVVDWEETESE
jgi:hypothetical protein